MTIDLCRLTTPANENQCPTRPDTKNIVVNGNLPKKIFGGEDTSIVKYPYHVSVQYHNYHFCNGAIISQYHILTAANCVMADRYVVYANIQVLTILKLSSEINFSVLSKAVSMPTKTPSNTVRVTGWGINPVTGIMTNELQRLFVETMASSNCVKKFRDHTFLRASQHCLITKQNSQLTQGNGGCPVMAGQRIIGIVSFIPYYKKDPVIFTYVYSYVKWIEEMKRKI
ncbi:chymotrypsin-2-like [Aphidius gifuensis]|uniref:chymotrypsin-2-like n=1 Tax=Aphidius gifuensis TaxID=684658 RepID=UPI001CDB4B2B|nr:chymotrypsin-2-like [Aphidius gifuensis]